MSVKLSLMLLTVFILAFLSSVSIGQTVQQVATASFKTPSLNVDSVTPYYHGIVIAMSYTNFTVSNIHKYYAITTVNVCFLNSTTRLLLYKSTLKRVPFIFTFIQGGELYVVVSEIRFNFNTGIKVVNTSYNGPAYQPVVLRNAVCKSSVYVFKGLKLVNTYVINGSLRKVYNPPLFNLTFPQIVTLLGGADIILLNNTNITVNSPLVELQLPKGILVAYANGTGPSGLNKFVNFTLFSYSGKVIWSRGYLISTERAPIYFGTPLAQPGAPALQPVMLEGIHGTVVGDKLFVVNGSTVLGINLNNGEIASRISLNQSLKDLVNIGGKLYLVFKSKEDVIVEEYNGSGLSVVAKVPVVLRIYHVKVRMPRIIKCPNGGIKLKFVNTTMNVTRDFTHILYNNGQFILITYPTLKGDNVTDVYYGGVTHYLMGFNITPIQIVVKNNDLMLIEKGKVLCLFMFNTNGTLRWVTNLGNTTRFPYSIRIVEVNPYKYYVVKPFTVINSKGVAESKVVVYEVTIQRPTTTTTVSSVKHTKTSSSTPVSYNTLVIIAAAVIVALLVALLVERRR
ncbi:hypothetical protein [Stygiolobus caldivivus]|uniref:Uncharacterized protein n=1 Tax=Stygiolobus caldivivus TaxID=2824673 RepID=A0A8D5ZEQ0_9CREN|nr:hypothetical protein [Stygiolobus caldivivus]BCU69808.1 hypothetical protein KN1_11050 [Stygiolobus caldivivus]